MSDAIKKVQKLLVLSLEIKFTNIKKIEFSNLEKIIELKIDG